MSSELSALRAAFHGALLESVLTVDERGIPSIADKGQRFSVDVATRLVAKLGAAAERVRSAGQTSGHSFEQACVEFVRASFSKLGHIRPGNWTCAQVTSRLGGGISQFEQYAHLAQLKTLAAAHPDLATALGNDYMIAPDMIISRMPMSDEAINEQETLVDDQVAKRTPLRATNNETPILLASISCKWTLRSDRAQNARSEALNLLRNRKGRCPNIIVVTAEPTPSRISSLALGTGDIDCVYHFALDELRASIMETGNDEALQMLDIMIDGKRLKDIADLPLDLAI